MKIIAATTNMNKVREIREILDEILSASDDGKNIGVPDDNCDNGTACDKCNADILLNKIEVISMAEAGIDADIPETGANFEENAEQKARAVMRLLTGARSKSNLMSKTDRNAALPRKIGEIEKSYGEMNLTGQFQKIEVSSAKIESNRKSCGINPPGVAKLSSGDIDIPNLSMGTADGDEKIIVIADDSGLEIDALGGAPGIHSARFMGHDTPYDIKCAAILDKMKNVPDEKRTARFICAMAVAWAGPHNEGEDEAAASEVTQKVTAGAGPHNEGAAGTTSQENINVKIFRGVMEGRIAHAPAGRNGFGYDPIFYLPEFGCTSAELSPDEKNSVSHRGKALRAALQYIGSLRSN